MPHSEAAAELNAALFRMTDVARSHVDGDTASYAALIFLGLHLVSPKNLVRCHALQVSEVQNVVARKFQPTETISSKDDELHSACDEMVRLIPSSTLEVWRELVRQLPRMGAQKGFSKAALERWFDGAIEILAGPGRRHSDVPTSVATLMGSLAAPKPSDLVLDLSCRTGRLLAAAAANSSFEVSENPANLTLVGYEADPSLRILAGLRLRFLNVHEVDIVPPNATLPNFPGKADILLSVPPAGAQLPQAEAERLISARLSAPRKGMLAETALASEAVTYLRPGGRAILLLPEGFLFRGGLDSDVRRRLVHSGSLKAVISLPEKLLAPLIYSRTALLLLQKPLRHRPEDPDPIAFVDARNAGVRKRNAVHLEQSTIEDIIYAARHGEPRAGLGAILVPKAVVEANEADLMPSRYMHAVVQQGSSRSPLSLYAELQEAENDYRLISHRCDELIAKLIS
jgi:SAM-dependent methyltransferase